MNLHQVQPVSGKRENKRRARERRFRKDQICTRFNPKAYKKGSEGSSPQKKRAAAAAPHKKMTIQTGKILPVRM